MQKFKGHLNTTKNFINCCFGSNQQFVAGGSEVWHFAALGFICVKPIILRVSIFNKHPTDIRAFSLSRARAQDGKIYLWDTHSGHLLSRLSGHSSVAYDVQWNAKQGLLARYCTVLATLILHSLLLELSHTILYLHLWIAPQLLSRFHHQALVV